MRRIFVLIVFGFFSKINVLILLRLIRGLETLSRERAPEEIEKDMF